MNSPTLQATASQLLASQLDYILIDGSGSMYDKWSETQRALDTYLAQLRAANLNSHIRLSVFDSRNRDRVERDTALGSMVPFSDQPLTIGGATTPLYDAIAIMGWYFRDINPARGTALIVTDGDENASIHCDLTQAKSILDWMRAKGWQVIFFGCDFNNSNQARMLGANPDTALGVQKALLSDATSMLARKRQAYGQFGTDINFTKDEQQQFGGYLAGPQGGHQ